MDDQARLRLADALAAVITSALRPESSSGVHQTSVKAGYCFPTDLMPEDEMAWAPLCTANDKGGWKASSQGVFDLAGCARLCRRCERCNHASFSLKEDECDWAYDCPQTQMDYAAKDWQTMINVKKADAATDAALKELPLLLNSLRCPVLHVPSEPQWCTGGGIERPCWMPTSQAPFYFEGLDPIRTFAPDFVWALNGETPSTIRGGTCVHCTQPFRGRSIVYLAFCFSATIQLDGSDRVMHMSSPATGTPHLKCVPWRALTRSRGTWPPSRAPTQHQIFNGLYRPSLKRPHPPLKTMLFSSIRPTLGDPSTGLVAFPRHLKCQAFGLRDARRALDHRSSAQPPTVPSR